MLIYAQNVIEAINLTNTYRVIDYVHWIQLICNDPKKMISVNSNLQFLHFDLIYHNLKTLYGDKITRLYLKVIVTHILKNMRDPSVW